jgi:hypothetical protein
MLVSLSKMRNKADRNDARGIAQIMRLGWYRAVHVKNIDMQKMSSLLSNKKLLRIAKRSNVLCAIVAVVRKLASILRRMWVNESDFDVGFGAKVTQRSRLKPVQ